MSDNFLVPSDVMLVLNTLRCNGFKSYIVGGSVRDLLIGRVPKDFDLCTRAKPEEVKKLFPKVISYGQKFGTVSVRVKNALIEVTTFREKDQLGENRGNNTSSIAADVSLRDFTINALLFDGEKIIDLVNGRDDLTNKVIRAVGDPAARFAEDPLRMMRAVRISCQLDFQIEANTLKAIGDNASLLKTVSPERIRDELVKMLKIEKPSDGIRLLCQLGLLKEILPEVEKCHKFEQKNPHHDKDIFEHILAVLDNTPNNLSLRLAALLHDIGKPVTFTVDDKGIGHFYGHDLEGSILCKNALRRLRFDNKTIEIVCKLVRQHMRRLTELNARSLKKTVGSEGLEFAGLLLELQKADELGSALKQPKDYEKVKQELEAYIESQHALSLKDLVIGGQDLIDLGFRPGPQIGKVLQQILEKVWDDPAINTREGLLEVAGQIQNVIDFSDDSD